MKRDIKIGTQDYTALVFIPDPASTDGSGKTGLNAAALTVSYTRVETDNDVVVTDVTSSLNNLSTLTDTHNDWGVKEVSSTLAPGLYRLDIADAVLAAGSWVAVVYVMITSSAASASPMEFVLVAFDSLDSVKLGLSALPNAAAEAAGGLYTRGTGAGQINQEDNGYISVNLKAILRTTLTEGATGRIAAAWEAFWNVTSPVATAQSVNQTGDSYARLGAPAGASIAADIAAGGGGGATAAQIWDRLTSALTTSGSIGELIVDNLNATISSRATPDDVDVTVAVSSTEAATIATGRLAISAGYTFRQTITSTSTDDLSAATKLWLSIKLNSSLADSASQIFIEKTAGLTVVAGAAYATVAHGSLTVGGSAGAWTIDIFIHDIATALLFGIGSDLRVAGLKYTKAGVAGDDLSAWDGSAVITDGIVRAVS